MSSFYPPKRILMGPGPSTIHPRVLEAMSRPTLGHLDPKFLDLMGEIKRLLKNLFKTENEFTFPISGPGTAGMETCIVNLVEPGDKVAVCINGYFGNRMKEMIERCGGEPMIIKDDWGNSVDPDKVENTLKENPEIKILAFVHAETSTGALSDAKKLSEIAHKHNCLVIADTVTSLGGVPVLVDEWQLDAVYSGSQKCLSAPPGLSPVTFSNKALEKINSRKQKVQSWFEDVNLNMNYWGEGKPSYHHTAPINSLYGLHEALTLLEEERIENTWKRHSDNSKKFCEGLLQIGLMPFVDEEVRIPELVSVAVPEGIDPEKVRSILLNDYNIEIGAGMGELAGKIWRIGLMGYSSSEENIDKCISALKDALNKSKK